MRKVWHNGGRMEYPLIETKGRANKMGKDLQNEVEYYYDSHPTQEDLMGETSPHVVFEVASEETWKNDVQDKPLKYALMGVEEYFYYDPDAPASPSWRQLHRSLLGWQFNKATGTINEMRPEGHGR